MKTHYAPKLHIIESEQLTAYSRHTGLDAWQPVYLAADVDARIAELEQELAECNRLLWRITA